MDWSAIRYFERNEWRQAPDFADGSLVFAMDRVRHAAGVPCYIHECYATEGHATDSYHYVGQAVDLHFGVGLTPLQEFLCLAGQPTIGGIGFYPYWSPRPGWHVDVRHWKTGRTYWVRGEHGYFYGWRALAVQLERERT